MYVLQCLYVCHVYAGLLESQKRASNAMELELKAIVSHLVGSGSQTQVFYKISKCSSLKNCPSSAPEAIF